MFSQRNDPGAVGYLAGFLPPGADISTMDELTFLGVFVRERCTRLSSDEEAQVLAHIDEQELLAADYRDRPW